MTAFHFRLHELGPLMLGGMIIYPAAMARDVVRHFRDFMRDAPDEVGGGLAFITAPPAPFVPEPVRGHPIVGIILTYAGPPGDGEAALAPMRAFGPPPVDIVQPMPYVAVQSMIDQGNPEGMQNYWTGDFYADLPDEAVDVMVEHGTHPVSPMSQMILIPGGGAISRVDDDATAFGNRTSPWNFHYLSLWPDPADNDTNIAYTRNFANAMKPWTTGRVYLNFVGEEGLGRVQAAYGPERFAKLQAIKATWDPTNLFRHNQNIPPTAT